MYQNNANNAVHILVMALVDLELLTTFCIFIRGKTFVRFKMTLLFHLLRFSHA